MSLLLLAIGIREVDVNDQRSKPTVVKKFEKSPGPALLQVTVSTLQFSIPYEDNKMSYNGCKVLLRYAMGISDFSRSDKFTDYVGSQLYLYFVFSCYLLF